MTLRRFLPFVLTMFAITACSSGESDAAADAMSETEEAPAGQEMASTAEADIDALREAWVTHYNLHHPDMVADLYAEESWVLNADQAVHEGREGVAAWLATSMEGDPTATVTTGETMVFGDQAVTMGSYQVEATSPEGDPMAFSGYYMNMVSQVDGEWLIEGSLTNYDEAPPEGWAWGEPGDEAPEENGTMTELVEAYETHWNLVHPDMVADLYAEDAVAAFANGPLIEGREAIAARMAEQLAEPTTLDVHDVGTMELDETHRIDGGWYELTAGEGGEVVQSGMYMLLAERQADGSWLIQRMITNAGPAPMQ